jgi:Ca2+/Na+ antiporter
MTLSEIFKREIHVAIHAQSAQFRVKKYFFFGLLFGFTYFLFGAQATLILLGALTVFAFAVHFFFRFKTKTWTQSWGPYKRIPLPRE